MTYNSRPKQVIQIPLDKLLFAIASLYLALTLAWIFHQTKQKQASVVPPVSNTNQAFIAHLEKSLENIDRKTASTKTPQPTPQPTAVPPVVRVAPPPIVNLPPPPEKPIERIYIPVYPQNPSFTPTSPAPSPKNVPPPPPVVRVAPAAIPPQTIITTGGKLVGVLELGDRSSALFDVNGVTKRIAIGENVNGWIVVKVENQQVFLSRGSTIRVINLGQSI